MGAIAKGFVSRMFAVTKRHLFLFRHVEFDGLKVGSLVRAVAKRLIGGPAATAPKMGARLQGHDGRLMIGNDRFGHRFFLSL